MTSYAAANGTSGAGLWGAIGGIYDLLVQIMIVQDSGNSQGQELFQQDRASVIEYAGLTHRLVGSDKVARARDFPSICRWLKQ